MRETNPVFWLWFIGTGLLACDSVATSLLWVAAMACGWLAVGRQPVTAAPAIEQVP